jgi:hypothetical protein
MPTQTMDAVVADPVDDLALPNALVFQIDDHPSHEHAHPPRIGGPYGPHSTGKPCR